MLALRLQSPRPLLRGAARAATTSRALLGSRPLALVIPQSRGLSAGAEPEQHTFQAETRQLLDIVTNSIYTDKEVFLRELISNASDALEKLRHLQTSGAPLADADQELEISISIDKDAKTLVLQDAGVGLTREEMVQNLGTIARSGSKAFVEQLKGSQSTPGDAATSIIGQFGVGFYSAFMVGRTVSVASQPASPEEGAFEWTSEGTGSYSIRPLTEGVHRGCRITIHLKEEELEFLEVDRLRSVITKYSNFVNFPIKLEGEVVNTVQAIWTQSPSEVSDEQYKEFYRFITNWFDEPAFRIHYRADAPLDLRVLLFLPSFHTEKWGAGRMDPGVSLYSRKVLIEKDSPNILPEWMRFVRGVVDSEDLPLSISREKAQDSRLLSKIRSVLVKRVLRFLNEKATKETDEYKKWFNEFGFFLKEGVCSDYVNQADIAKLLYFDSSKMDGGDLTTFDEYLSRCTPEQDKIYYLYAPSREMAEQSPYYEAFKQSNREVIFIYNAIDDFVMSNLQEFNKRKIISAESKDVDLGEHKDEEAAGAEALSTDQAAALGDWMKESLPDKLSAVTTTKRLKSFPAIVSEHESGALRKMMRMVEQQSTGTVTASILPPQQLEINPHHPIITGLERLRQQPDTTDVAKIVLEQLVDNAFVTAGLMDDSRGMVTRINGLVEMLIERCPPTAAEK